MNYGFLHISPMNVHQLQSSNIVTLVILFVCFSINWTYQKMYEYNYLAAKLDPTTTLQSQYTRTTDFTTEMIKVLYEFKIFFQHFFLWLCVSCMQMKKTSLLYNFKISITYKLKSRNIILSFT